MLVDMKKSMRMGKTLLPKRKDKMLAEYLSSYFHFMTFLNAHYLQAFTIKEGRYQQRTDLNQIVVPSYHVRGQFVGPAILALKSEVHIVGAKVSFPLSSSSSSDTVPIIATAVVQGIAFEKCLFNW